MKRSICILLFTLVSLLSANAQGVDGFRSFTVSTPETIMQDQTFQVIYRLEATNWSEIPSLKFPGYTMVSVESDKQELDGGYKALEISCKLRVSHSGKRQLPRIKVTVSGKEVLSDDTTIDVKVNSDHGWELNQAYEFLAERNVMTDTVNLSLLGSYGNLLFFNDRNSGHFALVADKSFADLVDSPIMAYGLSKSYHGSSLDLAESIKKIFSIYSWQLDEVKSSGKHWNNNNMPTLDLPANSKTTDVSPLLGKTAWGQNAPYNVSFPSNGAQGSVTGCGPLALSQLMRSYSWPQSVNGSKIDWSKAKDRYDKDDVSGAKWLSDFILGVANGMEAKIGTEKTSSVLRNAKPLLQRVYGYSPRMYYYKKRSDREMLSLIYRNINDGQTCLLSDDGHIFICDGRKGNFLHFNMGWGGLCNGYYRACFVDGMADEQLSVQAAMLDIKPQKSSLLKSVVMIDAGTLESKLTAEDVKNVTELKVIGPINGTDIAYLRMLAGANTDKDPMGVHGSVSHLDLSDATIHAGGDVYYEQDVTGSKTTVTQRQTQNGVVVGETETEVTLDCELPDETYERFAAASEEPVKYVKRDGRVYMGYLTKDCIVGANMFNGCQNLIDVKIPTDTKSVEHDAFSYTYSLEAVHVAPDFNYKSSNISLSDIFYNSASFCKRFVKN